MSEVVSTFNVAARLAATADLLPDGVAIAAPLGRGPDGKRLYRTVTFRELNQDSDRLARGLRELGVVPGMRLALLVRPGIDFISLVFALFKARAVSILIDPGMGRKNLLGCLAAVEPEGFIAIPAVQAVRTLLRGRFPKARINVTVGRRWFWGGPTLDDLRSRPWAARELDGTSGDEPAAIIFTTGSTGPPKGVLYRHGNFDRQVAEIRELYGIQPGEIDLPCFPLFGLFNCAMGVTTIIPDMDPSRPARVDPARIVEAIGDWQVTQAFGSPAVWSRVGPYCAERNIKLPSLRRVLSAGAPVPPRVLASMRACMHPDGEMHTPYGATEALPVATIGAGEVLYETVERTRRGGGTCVGRRFPGIKWRVIGIRDGALPALADTEELPRGQIGELIVRGPVVTREYVTRTEWNGLAKIADGETVWHRMGDVGYFDEQDRFWFCGRMSHRVQTARGTLFTEPCEAIFNEHPAVFRSALVGIGPLPRQRPVIIVQLWPDKKPRWPELCRELRKLAAATPVTAEIDDFLIHPSFPVDIRHNSKIFREKLAMWAARRLPQR